MMHLLICFVKLMAVGRRHFCSEGWQVITAIAMFILQLLVRFLFIVLKVFSKKK
jgi:hypothetical protein